MTSDEATGYKYDIFVSYPHVEAVARWVQSKFVPTLRNELRDQLPGGTGCSGEVFLSLDELKVGDRWEKAILEALAQSRVLVAILNGRYLRRKWCLQEIAHMRAREKMAVRREHETGGLIFPVRLSLPERNLPPGIKALQGVDFWDHYCETVDLPFGINGGMRKAIRALVKTIVGELPNVPEWDNSWFMLDSTPFVREFDMRGTPQELLGVAEPEPARSKFGGRRATQRLPLMAARKPLEGEFDTPEAFEKLPSMGGVQ